MFILLVGKPNGTDDRFLERSNVRAKIELKAKFIKKKKKKSKEQFT